ncbi:MAG: FG-GAP-like repeat-containing protein [Candidatus Zixiibacteriota bacterium]
MTLLRLNAIAAVMLFFFAGLIRADSGKILRIYGKEPLSIEKTSTQMIGRSAFKSDVSQKNLLGLERETPYSLPRLSKLTVSPAKSLKILGIRVEFEEEVPDDPRTTGNGLFDMRSQDDFFAQEGHLIDPSPHHNRYFETHILALHNYWWTVSEGELSLEGEVFPRDDDVAYRLPHPMAYYGAPDSSLAVKVEMLTRFFQDSFRLADSLSVDDDPQIYKIDFSQYDCFIIFHAGSDLQSDLGALVEPTPGDLFSGFIMLRDTVWVNDGIFPITEGTFLPETRSQDNRISALNGLFAHEFGHQLGLVDLYNSETFLTQVGDFALMDNNAQIVGVDVGYARFVSGVLPVYPCAWSRAYLGFVEPEEVTGDDTELFASGLLTENRQLIKIPISPEEYFLIENRQVDIDGDHFSGLRVDSTTNVILGPVNLFVRYNREYDWLLPGSGILIWHVDEGVAYLDYDLDGLNNFWDNQLQLDWSRRFLTIVEADGIIDFGGNYHAGYGRQEDMFYQGNKISLTPHTFPSSESRNGSDTHVWITDISNSGTLMTLDISQGWAQFGFPQKFIPETDASSLVSVKGGLQIFASSGRFIHAWGAGGAGLFPYPDSVQVMEFDSNLVTMPLAIFAEDDSDFVGPPSLGDLDGDDTLEVVAATVDGRVFAWHPYDRDSDGRADVVDGFPVDLGDRISVGPIIANFDSVESNLEIFVATTRPPFGSFDHRIIVISDEGALVSFAWYLNSITALTTTGDYRTNFLLMDTGSNSHLCIWNAYDGTSLGCTECYRGSGPVVAGDIDRDGNLDAVYRSDAPASGLVASDLKLGGSGFFTPVDDFLVSGPVLGDIDKDGYLEIIVASSDKIYAYNHNGTLVSNFPVDISYPYGPADLIESSPIMGDIDGDGYPDIIVGTRNRQILAYNWEGRMVDGFPVPVGGPVTSSPILMNLDKDLDIELLAAGDDGFIYAWDLPGEYDEDNLPWVMYGYDAGHTNYFPKEKLPPIIPLAGDLLPERMAFNYPNPAESQTKIRYFLKEDAEVGIRVYDLSGMLVDEFPGPGVGRTHNELPWDCSRFASGVYLCRVEAKSDNESQVVFFKMAIVK